MAGALEALHPAGVRGRVLPAVGIRLHLVRGRCGRGK